MSKKTLPTLPPVRDPFLAELPAWQPTACSYLDLRPRAAWVYFSPR
jgi:hypothetical protein